MYLKRGKGYIGGAMLGGAMLGGRRRRSRRGRGGRSRRGRGFFKNAAKKIWGVAKKGFKWATSPEGQSLIKQGVNVAKTLAAAGRKRRRFHTRRLGYGLLNNSSSNGSGPLP